MATSTDGGTTTGQITTSPPVTLSVTVNGSNHLIASSNASSRIEATTNTLFRVTDSSYTPLSSAIGNWQVGGATFDFGDLSVGITGITPNTQYGFQVSYAADQVVLKQILFTPQLNGATTTAAGTTQAPPSIAINSQTYTGISLITSIINAQFRITTLSDVPVSGTLGNWQNGTAVSSPTPEAQTAIGYDISGLAEGTYKISARPNGGTVGLTSLTFTKAPVTTTQATTTGATTVVTTSSTTANTGAQVQAIVNASNHLMVYASFTNAQYRILDSAGNFIGTDSNQWLSGANGTFNSIGLPWAQNSYDYGPVDQIPGVVANSNVLYAIAAKVIGSNDSTKIKTANFIPTNYAGYSTTVATTQAVTTVPTTQGTTQGITTTSNAPLPTITKLVYGINVSQDSNPSSFSAFAFGTLNGGSLYVKIDNGNKVALSTIGGPFSDVRFNGTAQLATLIQNIELGTHTVSFFINNDSVAFHTNTFQFTSQNTFQTVVLGTTTTVATTQATTTVQVTTTQPVVNSLSPYGDIIYTCNNNIMTAIATFANLGSSVIANGTVVEITSDFNGMLSSDSGTVSNGKLTLNKTIGINQLVRVTNVFNHNCLQKIDRTSLICVRI